MLEGSIPILWYPVIFSHVLALIWKSFLEIMRTAAPLIRAGNVCITKSVKLLHFNKNRRHFDPENWMTSTSHEVGALLSVGETKQEDKAGDALSCGCGQALRSELSSLSQASASDLWSS